MVSVDHGNQSWPRATAGRDSLGRAHDGGAGGWALQIGAEWQSVLTGDAISSGELFSDDYPALLATQFVWGSVLGGDSFNEYYGALFFANASNSALRIYTASLAAHRLSWGREHERGFSS